MEIIKDSKGLGTIFLTILGLQLLLLMTLFHTFVIFLHIPVRKTNNSLIFFINSDFQPKCRYTTVPEQYKLLGNQD